MWLVAMFDLPVDSPKARKSYGLFRKKLLEEGFSMLQYSVYARHCSSEEKADAVEGRIHDVLPPDGEVRLMRFTDKQYSRTRVFHGKIRKATERAPRQIELF